MENSILLPNSQLAFQLFLKGNWASAVFQLFTTGHCQEIQNTTAGNWQEYFRVPMRVLHMLVN